MSQWEDKIKEEIAKNYDVSDYTFYLDIIKRERSEAYNKGYDEGYGDCQAGLLHDPDHNIKEQE